MSKNTFVNDVCASILKDYQIHQLQELTLIIPSRRLEVHLRKEFSELIEVPAILPEIITISEWIERKTSHPLLDSLSQRFILYQCYSKLVEEVESFDSFLGWSNQILSDFADIDKYLLDAEVVFDNLQDIKEIENWSFNKEELSPAQQKFLLFWDMLGKLYTNYHEALDKSGNTVSYKVYRNLAENLESLIQEEGASKLFFIGFNAISKSEETIIKGLVKSGIAKVYWDIDKYFVQNKEQEAGMFIRNAKSWSQNDYSEYSDSLQFEKEFIVYPSASNLDQIHKASQILATESNQGTQALVFADESLLKPFLSALPESRREMNFAMGYALSDSLSFKLLEKLIEIATNTTKFQGGNYVYHKDYFSLIGQEVLNVWLINNQDESARIEEFSRDVKKKNTTYIRKEDLQKAFSSKYKSISFLFDRDVNPRSFVSGFVDLLMEVRDSVLNLEYNPIEVEAINSLLSNVETVAKLLEQYPFVQTLEGLNILVRQLIKSASISFYGEPLKGLQVLGLLETRGLDFDEVILLSCNEDVLPKRSFSDSLIPHDLRMYLGLPGRKEKDAIFAYYFYKLIQRAKKIHLIYNNGPSDGMNSNEVSRYLLQLEKDILPEMNTWSYSIDERSFEFSISEFSGVIQKDEHYYGRLSQYFKNGVSPSALNTYNRCALDFYFNYILRVSDRETVEEDMESSTYGTIVHKAFQNLYLSQGKWIGIPQSDQMIDCFEEFLVAQFEKEFPDKGYLRGKNRLLYETAKAQMLQWLKIEKKEIERNGAIEIIALESQLETNFIFVHEGVEHEILIKGELDRIDKVGGVVRVLDYKTGKCEKKNLNYLSSKLDDKARQLLVYLYLYHSKYPDVEDVSAGIISLKVLKEGVQFLHGKRATLDRWTDDLRELIEEELSALFQNMLVSGEIVHDSKSQFCLMCE